MRFGLGDSEEIKDGEVTTSYTRRVEAVQVRGKNQEVYLTFSPRFEPIWLESKKRLPEHVAQRPANIGLRSQYSIRPYSWAQRYITAGTKRISLEELRKVLGLAVSASDFRSEPENLPGSSEGGFLNLKSEVGAG